jgi:serine/threonine protein phosphatase PrpC
VDTSLGLFAVSDGMGGHAGGEVASKTAIEAVKEVVGRHRELIERITEGRTDDVAESKRSLSRAAREAVNEATERVYNLAKSEDGPSGMGCTLTVLVVAGRFGVMAHVGDSRLYQLRGKRVTQLSQDHTLVHEMAREGLGDVASLKNSPFAHVLSRAVGPQPAVQVDTLVFEIVAGDRYLLCSDGFSNHLETESKLGKMVGEGLDDEALDAAAAELVEMANASGGDDNITVVLVTLDGEPSDRAQLVESRYAALDRNFMFAGLDRAMAARVLEVCRVQRHDTGDIVVELGDETGELFIVVDGRYNLADEEGHIGQLGPGDYTGSTTLSKPRPSRARLQAAEPSRLLRMSGKAFAQLIRRRPWLGIYMLERLGNKLSADLERSYQQREGSEDTVRIRERF